MEAFPGQATKPTDTPHHASRHAPRGRVQARPVQGKHVSFDWTRVQETQEPKGELSRTGSRSGGNAGVEMDKAERSKYSDSILRTERRLKRSPRARSTRFLRPLYIHHCAFPSLTRSAGEREGVGGSGEDHKCLCSRGVEKERELRIGMAATTSSRA